MLSDLFMIKTRLTPSLDHIVGPCWSLNTRNYRFLLVLSPDLDSFYRFKKILELHGLFGFKCLDIQIYIYCLILLHLSSAYVCAKVSKGMKHYHVAAILFLHMNGHEHGELVVFIFVGFFCYLLAYHIPCILLFQRFLPVCDF